MYKEHFGLQRALFQGGIARDEDMFIGPRQQVVIANLKIALSTRDSVVTIMGYAGIGKTALVSRVLRMTATRLALAWVGSAPLNPDELLEHLLAEFDLEPYGKGRVERLQAWRQFMSELSVTDTRLCILVEDAEALGVESLRALESLTAADPNGCPGANVVLMGQAGLQQLLQTPILARLRQRIRSRQIVPQLTAQEVEAYLRHRTKAAGGEFEAMFAADTPAAIHSYSAGVPRVIDNISDSALSLAAARRHPQLTTETVITVAEKVYGFGPTVPLASAQKVEPAPEAPKERHDEADEQAAPVPPKAADTPEVVDAPESADAPEAVDAPEAAGSPVATEEAPGATPTPPVESPEDPERHPVPTPSTEEATEKFAEEPAVAGAAEEPAPTAEPAQAVSAADLEAKQRASEAIGEAKELEEISNSMAETLFTEVDMQMFDAALVAAGAGRPNPEPDASATGIEKLSAEETAAVLELEEDAQPVAEAESEAQQPAPAKAAS